MIFARISTAAEVGARAAQPLETKLRGGCAGAGVEKEERMFIVDRCGPVDARYHPT